MRAVLVVALAACSGGATGAVEQPRANTTGSAVVDTPPPVARPAELAAYDLPFDQVYAATLDVVRVAYPSLQDDPAKRRITTAWHQLPGNDPNKRLFGRLDIELSGPPWRIAITGRVADWRAGEAVPTELTSHADRAQLDATIADLRAAIHARLSP
jgi:hypothetical protein